MLSVKLHSHSSLSYDGQGPIEYLLERMVAVGLDALAMTDHDEIDANLEAAELVADYGLVGTPGMGVIYAAGHVPALGVEKLVPAGLSHDETLDRIHDAGDITAIPHPFQKSRYGVAPRISGVQLASADAIEIYNSRLLTGIANRHAGRLVKRRSLPITAGNDAHITEMAGQAVTEVSTDTRSTGVILSAVADGRTSVIDNKTPWRISFWWTADNATRHPKHALTDLF